jgi:SAM-dependent methyltransferase
MANRQIKSRRGGHAGPSIPQNDGDDMSEENRLQEARQYWDGEAATFDDAPDHGLRDPGVRKAWTSLLTTWLPPAYPTVLDAGCGTGSLSLVLAGLGHAVTGIDLSPAMIACAQEKALQQGASVQFQVMDAAYPRLAPGQFDALVCRHLLWALPEPAQVLGRWARLLKPQGRCILVEGFWATGAGLHAQEVLNLLPASWTHIELIKLSDLPELWGRQVSDERYAVVADRKS